MFRTFGLGLKWKKTTCFFVFLTILNIMLLVNISLRELSILEFTQTCPQWAEMSSDSRENRKKIASYPVGDSGPFLDKLGLLELATNSSFLDQPAVVVTAASSTHFSYCLGLVERLTTIMEPKLKIVVYDIGMSEEQRQRICMKGGCEVREFPFHRFPAFLKEHLQSIAWKPVLIQIALQEFGFVIWMDSVVYLIDGNLQNGIDIAKEHGIAVGYKRVTFPNINLAFETDKRTFEALSESPCAFRHSFKFNAALIFIRKSPVTYKYIMRPWVSCALTKSCIAADRESNSKCLGANRYGYCHRFDQSVLSIILNRLFHSKLTDIDLGNKVKWTKCFKKDLVMVFNEMVFLAEQNDQCSEVKWKNR